MSSDFHRKLLKDSIIIMVFNVLALFAGYLTRSVLSKTIPLEDFGLFYALFTAFMFIGVFVDLGFGEAIVRFIPQMKRKTNEILTIALLVRVVMTSMFLVLIVLFKPWLVHSYFKSPLADVGLNLFMVMLVLSNLSAIMQCYFQAIKNMFMTGLFYFLQRALFFIWILAFLFFGVQKGFSIPAYAYLISIIVLTSISIYYFITIRIKFCLDRPLFSKLLRFAFYSTMTSVASMILGYIDSIMLTSYYTVDIVGIYGSVLATVSLLSYFGGSIATVLLPSVAEIIHVPSKHKQLESVLDFVNKQTILVLLPLVVVFFFFTKEILLIFYTKDFFIGINTARVLLISMIPLSLLVVYNAFITAKNRPEWIFQTTLVGAILNVILNLLLIPHFSMLGAGIATAAAYIVMFFMTYLFLNKILTVRIFSKDILLMFIAISISFISLLVLRNVAITGVVIFDVAIKSSIFLGCYVLLCLLFRVLSWRAYTALILRSDVLLSGIGGMSMVVRC